MDESSVEELVGDAELILDCLDNFPTPQVLNTLAVRRGLPMIHAGVTGYCGQITFLHPPATACLSCIVPESPPPEVFPILGATAGLLAALAAWWLYPTGSSAGVYASESLLSGRRPKGAATAKKFGYMTVQDLSCPPV